ncbi:LOW QUALITY PROTEIN: ADP/ATP translocase 4 [Cariama cristata]
MYRINAKRNRYQEATKEVEMEEEETAEGRPRRCRAPRWLRRAKPHLLWEGPAGQRCGGCHLRDGVVPIKRVKLLLQLQASPKQIWADRQYKGMVGCFVCVPREQGSRLQFTLFQGLGDCIINIATDGPGLYEAFGVSVQGIIVYPASWFGCYGTIKGLLPNRKQTPCTLSFFIAQVVTTCSGMLSYLFDTVRRRTMMQSRETARQYKGTVDCFMKIHEPEGLNALFCGTFSTIRRSFSSTGGGLVLVLYGKIKDIFNLDVSESSRSD